MALPVTEHRFAVMGTTAHLVVVGSGARATEALVRIAEARLRGLHARWTRFDPASEISRLNAHPGAAVRVDADTLLLFERACEAWRRTGGRFDPTVLPALVAAGYDRSFELVDAEPKQGPRSPAPGCAGIELDRAARTVTLPEGIAFDPGGIGKGLAADLVATELGTLGARGACVNVGGDLHVTGAAPSGTDWLVELEHPIPGLAPVGAVRLRDAALVSTWRTRRAWGSPASPRHHLVDPATGAPAFTGLAGVCVVSQDAWHAEALAKAAYLAGVDGAARVLRDHGAAGMLIRDDGALRPVGGMEELLT